jgi:phosphatidylethanolamine/phosphatidyl-N-methylethanolamine N-methyltransferase
MRFIRNCRNFIREMRRDFLHTGALLPSSPFLGRAMTVHLRHRRRPARILEVGPGTGAITAEVIRRLQPGDQLDIVEINPRFVALLRRRLETENRFRQHEHQVRVIHAPVQEVAGHEVYDFILSSLPLNNFPSTVVRQVFDVFHRLLVPGGTLSFYEYVFVRHLKTPFVERRERERLQRIGWILGSYVRRYQFDRERIYANVPPAVVRHLRLKPSGALLRSYR